MRSEVAFHANPALTILAYNLVAYFCEMTARQFARPSALPNSNGFTVCHCSSLEWRPGSPAYPAAIPASISSDNERTIPGPYRWCDKLLPTDRDNGLAMIASPF